MINLDEWRARFLERLDRQVTITGDEALDALIDEVAGYPATPSQPAALVDRETSNMIGPIRIRAPDGSELTLFGMFATFDTPFEVITSELAVELLFPANRTTADAFKALARDRHEA